jgi:hypothetical protein
MSGQGQQSPSFDYSQMVASGAINGSNARSGAAVGEGQPPQGGMMPAFEGKRLELPAADVSEILGLSNADSMFASINQGGGPFGQSLTSQLGDSAGFLGTPEAKGDILAMEGLTGGDMNNMRAPTVQGDLQLKGISFKGGGASRGQ